MNRHHALAVSAFTLTAMVACGGGHSPGSSQPPGTFVFSSAGPNDQQIDATGFYTATYQAVDAPGCHYSIALISPSGASQHLADVQAAAGVVMRTPLATTSTVPPSNGALGPSIESALVVRLEERGALACGRERE